MGIFSIISLIVSLIVKLPSLIHLISQVMALIRTFKINGWKDDVALVIQILKLILGLAGSDKNAAQAAMVSLHDTMSGMAKGQVSGGLQSLHDDLKKKCDGIVCPMDKVDPA